MARPVRNTQHEYLGNGDMYGVRAIRVSLRQVLSAVRLWIDKDLPRSSSAVAIAYRTRMGSPESSNLSLNIICQWYSMSSKRCCVLVQ